MKSRHIVAMGGGGFSMEPDNPLLDDYVLGLTAKVRPRVCFIPTASGDADGYIERFHRAFPVERATAYTLKLFQRAEADLREIILNQDVIYVGGGNTANMLAVWRTHGVDAILREAYQSGIVLAGLSAGALCWFEAGITDSFGPEMSIFEDGLGLLAAAFSPHYDSEPKRKPLLQAAVSHGKLLEAYAADDGAALHFRSGSLFKSVASRENAKSYRVVRSDGQTREVALDTVLLTARLPRRRQGTRAD